MVNLFVFPDSLLKEAYTILWIFFRCSKQILRYVRMRFVVIRQEAYSNNDK